MHLNCVNYAGEELVITLYSKYKENFMFFKVHFKEIAVIIQENNIKAVIKNELFNRIS